MKTGYVFITGVNGGIGQSIANIFRLNDWKVIGTSIEPEPYSSYVISDYISADLSKEDDLVRIGDFLKEKYKNRLVCFVHVAGYQVCKSVEETTMEDFDKVFGVNVKALFYLSGVVNNCFEKKEKGKNSIIAISSIHAYASSNKISAYASSKSAINGLMKNLAIEFAPWVRVNSISPGAINTPMLSGALDRQGLSIKDLEDRHILERIGTGDEIGEMCLFLADVRKSGFITGTDLKADGGATCYLSTERI